MFSAKLSKLTAKHGIHAGKPVHLLVRISTEAVLEGTGTLSDAGSSINSFLCGKVQSYDISSTDESNRVVLGARKFRSQFKVLPHSYLFVKNDELLERLD